MFGRRAGAKHSGKDEAEKPFWISFADLMSALMVMFLLVMSVALLSVTKTVNEREVKEEQHRLDIALILTRFEEAAAKFPGIKVDKSRQVIDFGQRAQFDYNRYTLTVDQERLLREFVPEILIRANDEFGRRILKRIVVEGFTDRNGSYLSNLNLSLQRSQIVLCSMFKTQLPAERPLTENEKQQIRALFLVGGYSFNSAKESDAESRRVEMRLEFLGIGDPPRTATLPANSGDFGKCAL